MSNKMKNFDMKDVHSGYVVQFRDGTYALCMRVGEKFTKIFARTGFKTLGVMDVKEGTHFFYTSSYKGECHYVYDPICNRTKPDPAFDIVKVYGLIHGVDNYLMVGDITITNRPLLWEEDIKEMTLEEVEQKLGHRVKIVGTETPVIKCFDNCRRCAYDLGHKKCPGSAPYCHSKCEIKAKYGTGGCPCLAIKDGEVCPYFEEEKK
jgi:hypothetical protein